MEFKIAKLANLLRTNVRNFRVVKAFVLSTFIFGVVNNSNAAGFTIEQAAAWSSTFPAVATDGNVATFEVNGFSGQLTICLATSTFNPVSDWTFDAPDFLKSSPWGTGNCVTAQTIDGGVTGLFTMFLDEENKVIEIKPGGAQGYIEASEEQVCLNKPYTLTATNVDSEIHRLEWGIEDSTGIVWNPEWTDELSLNLQNDSIGDYTYHNRVVLIENDSVINQNSIKISVSFAVCNYKLTSSVNNPCPDVEFTLSTEYADGGVYKWYDKTNGVLLGETATPQFSTSIKSATTFELVVDTLSLGELLLTTAPLSECGYKVTSSSGNILCADEVTMLESNYTGAAVYEWRDKNGNTLLATTEEPRLEVKLTASTTYVLYADGLLVGECALSYEPICGFFITSRYPISSPLPEQNYLIASGSYMLNDYQNEAAFTWYKSADSITWTKIEGNNSFKILVDVDRAKNWYYRVDYNGKSARIAYPAPKMVDASQCNGLEPKMLFYETFGFFMSDNVYVRDSKIYTDSIQVDYRTTSTDQSGNYIGTAGNYDATNPYYLNTRVGNNSKLNVDFSQTNKFAIKNYVAPDPMGYVVTASNFVSVDEANQFVATNGHLFQSENPVLSTYGTWCDLDPTVRLQDGYYAIVSDPVSCDGRVGNPDYVSAQDASGMPNGGMLFVNAGNTNVSKAAIYAQKVDLLCPAKQFSFSMNVRNATKQLDQNPVNLTICLLRQFTDSEKVFGGISDAVMLGSVNTQDIPSGSTEWTSVEQYLALEDEGVHSMWVVVYNNGETGNGNDILMDDITFSVCVPKVDISAEIEGKVYTEDVVVCSGGIDDVILRAKQSTEYIKDPYYIFQYATYNETGVVWVDLKEYNSAEDAKQDSVIISSSDKKFAGEVQYRVVIAGFYEDARLVSQGIGTGLRGCDYDVAQSVLTIKNNYGGKFAADTVAGYCKEEGWIVNLITRREAPLPTHKWLAVWKNVNGEVIVQDTVEGDRDTLQLVLESGLDSYTVNHRGKQLATGVAFDLFSNVTIEGYDFGKKEGDKVNNCPAGEQKIAVKAIEFCDPCTQVFDAIYKAGDACEFTPGAGEVILPPLLKDSVLGDFIGTYEGRIYGVEPSIAHPSAGFDKTIGIEETYKVGITYILWSFAFPGNDTVYCIQKVYTKTSREPLFDCENVADRNVSAPTGVCEAPWSSIVEMIFNPWPTATDACTGKLIPGVAVIGDSVELTNNTDTILKVGAYDIKWIFIDTTINEVAKVCEQKLVLQSDKKPIFDCQSLSHDTILIEGCDTTLSEQDIEYPFAIDACTGDSIQGVGKRLDGGPLFGLYPVGTTIIRWIFTSPYSTKTDSCDQSLTILTKQEMDFKCESLSLIKKDVPEGECSVEVEVNVPKAPHPCPEQAGIDSIVAVGKRSDNKSIDAPYPVGVTTITWTFKDITGTMQHNEKVCTQDVQVGDVNQMPLNCDNIPDTIVVLSPEDCEITWGEINFNAPSVVDLCTKVEILPTLSRWSGKTMEETFDVGVDTIYWNYKFATQDFTCSQAVIVLDSMAPTFDCNDLKPIALRSLPGECYATGEALIDTLNKLNPIAKDVCTNNDVIGVPTKLDGSALPTQLSVGDTLTVLWTFKSDTMNAVGKYCEQMITVLGDGAPQFDCSSLQDTTIYLTMEQCELSSAILKLNVPIAKDSCTGADVPGTAMGLKDIYPVGTTPIVWLFDSPYSITTKECPQNIIVVDTFAPDAPCEDIVDTLNVGLTVETTFSDALTLEEAKAQGLVNPTMDDLCDGLITAYGVLENGTNIELLDKFPVGNTTIYWVFEDKSGNKASCTQVLQVSDWVLEEMNCPNDFPAGGVISCLAAVPAPYQTFEAFKAAGGTFSNDSKIQAQTFKATEIIVGDSCNMTYTRRYSVLDVRGNEISCEQTLTVVDDEAPEFIGEAKDVTILCQNQDEIPAVPEISIADNCDPNPTLVYSEYNNRGGDPKLCDYYNYTIARKWVATDRCGNESVLIQYIKIIDDSKPQFDIPASWTDTSVALAEKGCQFLVPDFRDYVKSFSYDNCTDTSALSVYQSPAEFTPLSGTTTLNIIVEDMCGNKDTLKKVIVVPTKESVITVLTRDTVHCGSDSSRVNLWSQQLRFATGSIMQETIRKNSKGEYVVLKGEVSATPVYDCYEGELNESSLIYSDNPQTYASLFSNYKGDELSSKLNKLLTLNKKSQSGKYIYVVMDTFTYCYDTVAVDITINEAPRISMPAGMREVCELTVLDSVELDSWVTCEDDMGMPITKRGWLLDGEEYHYSDTVTYNSDLSSLVFYSENACGRTTSDNSYFTFCTDATLTTEDSLAMVGNIDNLLLLRNEELKVDNKIQLKIRQRFDKSQIMLTSEPKNPSRIWESEEIALYLSTDYQFAYSNWYKVVGLCDFSAEALADPMDEPDELVFSSDFFGARSFVGTPQDTSKYYVALADGVCPPIASDVLQVDVLPSLPTAFTPYVVDGLNDIFMEGREVVIFDRYGAKVFEGNNGWDGTHKGRMVDPGVYFCKVVLGGGVVLNGSIEVVKTE